MGIETAQAVEVQKEFIELSEGVSFVMPPTVSERTASLNELVSSYQDSDRPAFQQHLADIRYELQVLSQVYTGRPALDVPYS